MKMPMPDDALFDEASALVDKLEGLRALLVDADRVSLRVVTTAERIVVQEAKRAFAWLHLYGYNVDAVVANRLYPDEALAGYFERWTELQRASMQEIEEGFAGVPVLRLMLRHGELRGLDGLRAAADELYDGLDPALVLARAETASLTRVDGALELSLAVPFFDKRDLDLRQGGDALVVALKNQRRRIPLPEEARGRAVTGARYEDGRLVVRFEG